MRMFVQVGRKGTGWHGEETLDVGHGVFVLLFPPPPLFLSGLFCFLFFFLLLLFSVHHQHLHRHDSHHRLSVALPHNIIIIDIYTATMGPIVVSWLSVWLCLFFISCSRCCRFISLYILWQGNYAVAIVYCRRIIHQPDQTRRIFHFPMYRAMARTVEETALL